MRAMRAEELETYNNASRAGSRSTSITYTVVSKGEWIRDDTGGTQSCTNNEKQVDYLKITSTVTSNRKGTKPVTLTSLVAPPPASAAGHARRQGARPRQRARSRTCRSRSAAPARRRRPPTTSAARSSRRSPSASYTVTLNKAGGNYPSVDKAGKAPATLGTVVTVGAVRFETMYFDQSGRIPVKFDTTDLAGAPPAAPPAAVDLVHVPRTRGSRRRRRRAAPRCDAGDARHADHRRQPVPVRRALRRLRRHVRRREPGAPTTSSRSQVVRGPDAAALTVRQPALNVRVDADSNSQPRRYGGERHRQGDDDRRLRLQRDDHLVTTNGSSIAGRLGQQGRRASRATTPASRTGRGRSAPSGRTAAATGARTRSRS